MFLTRYHHWKYRALLLSMLSLLLTHAFTEGLTFRQELFDVLLLLVLVTAFLALGKRLNRRIIALFLGMPVFIGTLLVYNSEGALRRTIILAGLGFSVLFFLFIACVLILNIFRDVRVTQDNLVGTICVYLLIGLAWGNTYSLLELTRPGSFKSDLLTDASLNTQARLSVLIYYSFATLTTLGYGDILPTNGAARTISWLEAMIGQFYIAVVVARLVGLHIAQKPGEIVSERD